MKSDQIRFRSAFSAGGAEPPSPVSLFELVTGTKYRFSSSITSVVESGPALRPEAPPQQRPVSILPSYVKRKTGRFICLARASAAKMLGAQPT